jgi:hypothetical protein
MISLNACVHWDCLSSFFINLNHVVPSYKVKNRQNNTTKILKFLLFSENDLNLLLFSLTENLNKVRDE